MYTLKVDSICVFAKNYENIFPIFLSLDFAEALYFQYVFYFLVLLSIIELQSFVKATTPYPAIKKRGNITFFN